MKQMEYVLKDLRIRRSRKWCVTGSLDMDDISAKVTMVDPTSQPQSPLAYRTIKLISNVFIWRMKSEGERVIEMMREGLRHRQESATLVHCVVTNRAHIRVFLPIGTTRITTRRRVLGESELMRMTWVIQHQSLMISRYSRFKIHRASHVDPHPITPLLPTYVHHPIPTTFLTNCTCTFPYGVR